MQLPGRFNVSRLVTSLVYQLKQRRSEDDHLHLSCKSSDSEGDYQKMLVNNMANSRISLNHIQQKTNLLTITVIRKRRRWTWQSLGLYRVVSIFVVVFYLFSSSSFFHSGKNILGHFKRHFVPQISSQSLKQGHV